MSYRLELQETLPEGIKRIALEQIDQALTQLTTSDNNRDEAVHEARKSFKKIRAALRLARGEIGKKVYNLENLCYRDAARGLSDVRDSAVMVETLDKLTQHFADQLDDEAFAGVREKLVGRHQEVRQSRIDSENAITEVVATIHAARLRVADWPLKHDDFSALSDGLKRVYRRGRKCLADAHSHPTPENFHEWRKRVKYLWYQIRILQPVWSEALDTLSDLIHNLSDLLGDDHDLSELHRTVLKAPELCSDEDELQALLGLIDQCRAERQADAWPLGERIYAEKPSAFVRRMAAYWRVWRQSV